MDGSSSGVSRWDGQSAPPDNRENRGTVGRPIREPAYCDILAVYCWRQFAILQAALVREALAASMADDNGFGSGDSHLNRKGFNVEYS